MNSRVERTHGKEVDSAGKEAGGWLTRPFHICAWISREEQMGSETRKPRAFSTGNERLKMAGCKNLRGFQR